MKISPTVQASTPPGRPDVYRPVKASLGVPLYYLRAKGETVEWKHSVFCSETFAETVLVLLEEWARKHRFAIVHLGFYAARQARKRNGQPIMPPRWSNHAYGEAVDFAGIITDNGQGQYLNLDAMKDGCPAKLAELKRLCLNAISSEGREPEIVDEGEWLHVGIFPRGYTRKKKE